MSITKSLPRFIKSTIVSLFGKRFLYFSQAGQDFWVFGEVFNEKKNGYFLDIGAHDGIALSNTYLLECRYGWNGICVEANPVSFELLKKNRRSNCINMCVDSFEGLVDFAKGDLMGGIISADTDNVKADSYEVIQLKTQTLRNILIEQNAPHEIDYLSIDIEGAEERVLSNFNFKEYQFNCITIERPTEQLRKIFKENGYVLIKEIPYLDSFYIHQNFLNQYQTNLLSFYKKKYIGFHTN